MRMSSLRTLGQREMRSTGCIVDDKRESRLMYVKKASTLNEGQNVSFDIVPRLRTRHRNG
jgi:hypothetical protein